MGSILYLHPEAQRIRLLKKMLLKTIIFVSLMAVAMGGPATRPPARPTYPPRNGESCGNFPNFMTGDRIVGGEAAASPIPWQVSVRQGTSGWGHFCGGTILDAKTVMCAAHCFDKDQSMSGYYVTAGVKDRKDNVGGQNNNPECDFDGGDCCPEEPANGWDQYCSDCLCIEIPETTEAPIECTGVNQWIGDNYCDDV